MTMLVDLANHIRTLYSGEDVLEPYASHKDAFVNEIPSEAEKAILVFQEAIPVNHEISGYYRGYVQVVVRSDDQEKAETVARDLFEKLNVSSVQIGSTYFSFMRPEHLPLVYPRTGGDLYEASVNFEVAFHSSPA